MKRELTFSVSRWNDYLLKTLRLQLHTTKNKSVCFSVSFMLPLICEEKLNLAAGKKRQTSNINRSFLCHIISGRRGFGTQVKMLRLEKDVGQDQINF